jgi:hypothetical protein
MALERLNIHVEKNSPGIFEDPFAVLFNPNQVTITKTGWKERANGPVTDDSPTTFTMDLFFDTTLSMNAKLGKPQSVNNYTKQVFRLVEVNDRLGRPPLCKLTWGHTLMQRGILKTVTTNLTQFLEDGTPVRATLNCSFQEWVEPRQNAKADAQQQPKPNFAAMAKAYNLNFDYPSIDGDATTDYTVHQVSRSETLSSIAHQKYGNQNYWPLLAKVNGLDNPRQLPPGLRLTIPPLS